MPQPPQPFKPSKSMLEPEYEPLFNGWKQKPSPESAGALLRALRPTIDTGLAIHAGGDRSSTAVGHARRIALNALGSYDPSRAKLSTHVISNMQSMRRYERQRQQVLRVPEQVSLARHQLLRASADLEDIYGREPTDEELSDHTGVSSRRLQKIRAAVLPASEGMFADNSGSDEESAYDPATYQPGGGTKQLQRAMHQTVYADLNPVNQKIFEWTLGWNGHPKLENREIAKRLNLSPGAISQRKSTIQQLLTEAAQLRTFS